MGFDPTNSHYGVEENRAIITESAGTLHTHERPTTAARAPLTNGTGGTATSRPEVGADEGMYL